MGYCSNIFGTGSGDSAAKSSVTQHQVLILHTAIIETQGQYQQLPTMQHFQVLHHAEPVRHQHELKWNEGSQRFETTLSDSNGVYQIFDFGISGYSVDKNGNSITISSTSVNTTATTGTFTSNAGKVETTSSCVFWLTGKSGYQEFISERMTADPIKTYIKVKTENIDMVSLQRQTVKRSEAFRCSL